MRKAVSLLAVAVVAAGLAGSRLQAQTLETGTWTARMLPPDSEFLEAFFHVQGAGDSLQISLEVPSFRTFPVHAVRVDGDYLSFRWRPGVELRCSVDRQADGSFQGGCLDPRGGRGPILMVPPGVNADSVTINEEVFYADWEIYQEETSQAEPLGVSERPPGTVVDVGGARLNIVSMGEGVVTVVLEAGLGDDLNVWRKVQEEAAAFARVVAYDRAGLGLSDPVSTPRTPGQIARELHTLLQKAGVDPPYVLVGHAAGGLYIRRFASLFPDAWRGWCWSTPATKHRVRAGVRWIRKGGRPTRSRWTPSMA